MMNWLALFITFFVISAEAQTNGFKSPDILIDSKLDYDWSRVLISKIRTLLKNYNMDDPFEGRFRDTILLNETVVGKYLPANSKGLIRDFGNAIGLSVLNAETKVYMHGFSYDVKGFKTDLKTSEVTSDGIIVSADFSASKINLSAEKVSLSLVIPSRNGSNPPVLTIDIIKPTISADEDKLISFFAKVKLQDEPDFLKPILEKANFEQMANGLLKNKNAIDLSYERVVIPKVSIKVGNKTINFSSSKIEGIIRDNHEAIKGILLAQAASLLRSNTTEAALKVIEKYKIQKEHWLGTPQIKSQFKVDKISTVAGNNHISVNVPGDFCITPNYNLYKNGCINHKITKSADSRLNEKLHQKSLVVIRDLISTDDTNIVASVSEDYINKLLVSTLDAGLWKKSLTEAGIELGPNKVVVKLDKQGDSGTFIMDVVYKPTKKEKLFTGSKIIRFPLVLDVSIRIEKRENAPVVIIRLNDVDTSNETLINGRVSDGFASTVKDVPRFKGKVVSAIREKVAVLRNTDAIELRYPEFSGLSLDKVDFISDGNGRMNAIMRLEELMEDLDANY